MHPVLAGLCAKLRNIPLGACVLCRMDCALGEGLCGHCSDSLVLNRWPCTGCAFPLPGRGGLCGGCLGQRRRPLDGVVAPFLYEEPLDGLVIEFKHNARLDLLRALLPPLVAGLAARKWQQQPQLVPVALHWRRLWRRGFNQSLLIARELGRALGWPVAEGLLQRHRYTVPQQGMGRKERRRNVRGAFATTAAVPHNLVLVDDVMTTGATAEEAALALRRGGARQVHLCALARAGRSY